MIIFFLFFFGDDQISQSVKIHVCDDRLLDPARALFNQTNHLQSFVQKQ
jgi:hypothetical protein